MHAVDWLIIAVPLVVIATMALRTRRYTTSVADFTSARRCAGRYLVCNARGEIAGVISTVAAFEYYYKAGFSPTWWTLMTAPVLLFVSIIGFVIVRFRETRALTLAQFFEMRYSRRFRVFAGAMAFICGAINYGIFPAVGSRFLVYFLDLPTKLPLGPFSVPTYVVVMVVYLSISLTMVLVGGQLMIMVADCLEGMMSYLFYLLIACALLAMFSWAEICRTLSAAPPGQSMLNPFDTAQAADFNIWYVMIGLFGGIYSTMAWQGGQGFNSCALNPHEAQMGNILAGWRGYAKTVMVILLTMCAYTFFNHPVFSHRAIPIESALAAISDPQIRDQMRVPVILRFMLPIVIKGMFASAMLFSLLACDASALHSWGTILIQDVLLPFHKKALDPARHLKLLRWAIVGVAAFGFLFSLLFRQTQYILMFQIATGSIYLGGAGAVIIGGLYWKKGTAAASWCALITGALLAFGSLLIQQLPFATMTVRVTAPNAASVTLNDKPAVRKGQDVRANERSYHLRAPDVWEAPFDFRKRDVWQSCRVVAVLPEGVVVKTVYYALGSPKERQPVTVDAGGPALTISPGDRSVRPLPNRGAARLYVACRSVNGQVLYFIATVAGICMYILVSLLTCRRDFDLERMLHRGRYASEDKRAPGPRLSRWSLGRILGFDEHFTRGDKAISISLLGWNLLWALVAAIGTVWALIRPWPLGWWQSFWHLYAILFPLLIGAVVTVWFTWGGIRDLRRLFAALRTVKSDPRDDGRVVDHHNLDEEPPEAGANGRRASPKSAARRQPPTEAPTDPHSEGAP